jgi:RNA polymerase sigma-70 factor (ECF subfamily)
MRWELNDMARRLDEQPAVAQLPDESLPAPAVSGSGLTADARRIMAAIDGLPEDDREAFDQVRIQGMSQAEAAEVLGVSVMTFNRRLHPALRLLTAGLGDLYPGGDDPTPTDPAGGGTAP